MPLRCSLPESVRYLVAKNAPVERIRGVLRRISAPVADASAFVMSRLHASHAGCGGSGGLRLVLSRSYVVGSRHAVARLLHGPGDVLRADQLDADPVQRRRLGSPARDADLGPVSRSAASAPSCSAG